jgi:FAD/FMN-containing dehydrogenase
MTTHEIPMLAEGSVAELAQSLRGRLIRPSDPDYDQARAIWNGAHDRYPVLIARCAGVADVIRALEFARSEELVVAVRAGGHSIPGFSSVDGGLVIDLSPMQGIRVDAAARRAYAQAGLTWAAFDHETQAFGLATTGGEVATVGICRAHAGRRHRLASPHARAGLRQPHRG